MPVKQEILYPIFLECCQYTKDIFWEGIFEDLAYGRTPRGTYISKGFLCCGYKNKEFNYKIERKNPEVLHDDIYDLLTNKLGLLSRKEQVKKRLVFHEIEQGIKDSRQEWANIRKKNVKDNMYEKYVIEMKQKYSLTIKQTKILLSLILISIIFKTITSKDIIFEEDRIVDIKGIEIKDGEIIQQRGLCSMKATITETPVSEQETKKMSDNWHKYIKQLSK